MRKFIASLIILLFSYSSKSQSIKPTEGPGFYLNNFITYSESNTDSALYFAEKLAADPRYSFFLRDMIHNIFAQSFQPLPANETMDSVQRAASAKSTDMAYRLLNKMMVDTCRRLVQSVRPVYYWTKIQQNAQDSKEMHRLASEFVATELQTDDLYHNTLGRYALLIYQELSRKKDLDKLSGELFATIYDKLKANQVIINTDTASRLLLNKRTWYRYLFAYSNFVRATTYIENGNKKEAGKYFSLAFEYSPDLVDKNNASAYFYDMHFLLGKEKRSFQDDYLNYLTQYSDDKKQTLSVLLAMSLTNPAFKDQLQAFYEINYTGQETFEDFWIKNINKNLKIAPAFSIRKMDGNIFSSEAHKGKWTLIDFWGTWCSPCREEHPALQKFYKDISAKTSGHFELITIACKDAVGKVSAYMTQKGYNFPVAMADNTIENLFNINSYPSKILITPQGKFMVVPFGENWVEFIKKYAGI